IDLMDLQGKIVIVDFWATWCGPCVNSFPSMQEVVKEYKNNDDVVFLFVNCWEQEKDVQAAVTQFIKERGYNFKVLMDYDNKVVSNFKVEGIPTKFIIGPDGYVKFKSVGFEPDESKMKQEMDLMIELARKN
ncbi:MAG: TlpA disulfide reductase family protein, partial [Bacteroidota bacterium]